MEEDDMDFTPSSNTSSNLASLFGFAKKPLQGNSSLTYTPPKAPKGETGLAKKPTEEKTKGKIIFSKAVHAYKLENRTYISQGLIGIVISGNHDSRVYEIILYKRNKEHISQIRMTSNFSITLSPNNYVSFYDNNKQNWSIMFQSPGDVEQFSQKIAICKFYSYLEPPAEPLIQDVMPSSQQKATLNSVVDIAYSSYALIPEEISKLKEDLKERIKLSTCSFIQLSKSLIGCSEGCKRIIIIPHSLGGPWLNELNPNKDLLLEVKLDKIVPEVEPVPAEPKIAQKDGTESPVDSSMEEATVKSKGVSIKEALSTTKTQKANLISRMARMGQATLPVKPVLSAGQSDSEDDSRLQSSPKPRLPRSRVTASNPPAHGSLSQTAASAEAAHQLSVYHNELSWHQAQKAGVMYQHLIPVPASPITSPTTDPNMSVYVSESRIQAAELRMGISKISEKLDAIWSKMQTGPDNRVTQVALVDTGGILSSIQNLISENESLKEKVEEQKGKIDQQNDRIYNLLELNHKYVEQNSTAHDKQSAQESKLKTEVMSLQKKEQELEESNKIALDKVRTLTEDLIRSEETNKELKKRLEESSAEAETLKKDLEMSQEGLEKEVKTYKEKLSNASEAITTLEKKLKEVSAEKDACKWVINVQSKYMDVGMKHAKDAESRKNEDEKIIDGLKQQISQAEEKTELQISNMKKIVAKLELENKDLLEKIKKQEEAINIEKKVPRVMSVLKNRLSQLEEHMASDILKAVENIFEGVTGETPDESNSVSKCEVVPAPRKSLHNPDTSKKENEELVKIVKEAEPEEPAKEEAVQNVKESSPEKDEKIVKILKEPHTSKGNGTEKEKNESDDQKKKETNSRYKSYDQGWRTTKPPPPPLFDEDDDTDEWFS